MSNDGRSPGVWWSKAASPADLVVRSPEARPRVRRIWGCGWAAADGEAASPADLRVRLGGGGGRGRESGGFEGAVGGGAEGEAASKSGRRPSLCGYVCRVPTCCACCAPQRKGRGSEISFGIVCGITFGARRSAPNLRSGNPLGAVTRTRCNQRPPSSCCLLLHHPRVVLESSRRRSSSPCLTTGCRTKVDSGRGSGWDQEPSWRKRPQPWAE